MTLCMAFLCGMPLGDIHMHMLFATWWRIRAFAWRAHAFFTWHVAWTGW